MQLLKAPVWYDPPSQESYPSTPPIWFVDSDDPSLAEVLERLEDVRKGSTLVSSKPMQMWWLHYDMSFLDLRSRLLSQLLQQLKRLICDLCRLYNLPQHPDVEMLDQPLPAGPINPERKVGITTRRRQRNLLLKSTFLPSVVYCTRTTDWASRWGDVWGRGGGRNGRGA